MTGYVGLAITACMPAFVAVIIYKLKEKNAFERLAYWQKQLILGIVFGLMAIISTEFGVDLQGAQLNCRDASVMIAGFIFGAPAGIIAGLIGGIERWIAVAWGIGAYTRVACSLSTILAGFIAAGLRVHLFEKKRPNAIVAMLFGVMIEAIHLNMVFLTHMYDVINALKVVKICTIPMMLGNGGAIFLAVMLVSLVSREPQDAFFKKKSDTPVFERIQKGFLAIIILSIALSSFFMYRLGNNLTKQRTAIALHQSLSRLYDEIELQINEYMINSCKILNKDIISGQRDLDQLAKKYEVNEINLVDQCGTIIESNTPEYIGFDMASGTQSSAFLCLLNGEKQYVQGFTENASHRGERKYVGIATENGFLQIGYDEEGLTNQISKEMRTIVNNRYVGTDGFLLIFENDGDLVSCSKEYNARKVDFKLPDPKEYSDSKLFYCKTKDGLYYCMIRDAESYKICGIYPANQAAKERQISVLLIIFMMIIIFIILYIAMNIMIKSLVVKQLVKIADSLSLISQGNLDEEIHLNSSLEFFSLSNDINHTVSTLKNYIAEAEARIDAELEMATRIQTSVLPSAEGILAMGEDLDIYAAMDPAKEVGGDFYDFYYTSQNELNIMVADVSGKGIPAAMFMMRAKSILHNMTELGKLLEHVFMDANNELCEGNEADMFVTSWQGRIHTDTGMVECINAGHNPPLLYRKNVGFQYLKQKHGMILGAMENIKYKCNEFVLQEGDILFLYTDGVVEATNCKDELYGEERLLQILNANCKANMNDLLLKVREDIDRFVEDAPQFDDLTMVAIKYKN